MKNHLILFGLLIFIAFSGCRKASQVSGLGQEIELARDYYPLEVGNTWYYSEYTFDATDTLFVGNQFARINKEGVLSYFRDNQSDSFKFMYYYDYGVSTIRAGGGYLLMTDFLSESNEFVLTMDSSAKSKNQIYGGLFTLNTNFGVKACIFTRHQYLPNSIDTIFTNRFFAKGYGLVHESVGNVSNGQITSGNFIQLDSISF